MKRPASRWLAVPTLVIAVAAFGVAAWHRRRDPPPTEKVRVTVEGFGTKPIGRGSVPQGTEKGVRLNLPEEPAIGRTVYVRADAETPGGGDGSLQHPFADLQATLCGLEPGDRLILWDGEFRGPFSIGEQCKDGTSDAPIEVYAAADSVLHGGEHTDEPVLTLARAHWHLHDLMVVPLESLGGGVALRPPARDILLESPHIRSGRGNGIDIYPGVSGVVIHDAHLHHLGIQEGGGGRQKLLEGGGGKDARGERIDAATRADPLRRQRGGG